jgi:hypothetical protein
MLESMTWAVAAFPYVVPVGGLVFFCIGVVEFEISRRRGNPFLRWAGIGLIGLALLALGLFEVQLVDALRPVIDPYIQVGELDGATAAVFTIAGTLTAVACILIPKARSIE